MRVYEIKPIHLSKQEQIKIRFIITNKTLLHYKVIKKIGNNYYLLTT